ncbi:hypothetical protein ACOJTA_00970 [Malaciobacter sp. WC5094]
MKKHILCSALISFATINIQASDSISINQIKCSNNTEGFNLIIKNNKINKTISYNSCTDNTLSVVNSSTNNNTNTGQEETVTIRGEEFTFVNGYVNPTTQYNPNSQLCTGWIGTSTVSNTSSINCENNDFTVLNENFLHVIEGGSSWLSISNSHITDLLPLSNLRKVPRHLAIRKNQNLTSYNGLENLVSIGYAELLRNPNVTDISALRNIKTITYDKRPGQTQSGITIDRRNYDVKLPANSYICNEGWSKVQVYDNGKALEPTAQDKSNICE